MTLHAYRSQRVEELVGAFAELIPQIAPADPFEPLPVIVGSRGMERWLRHELATALGSLARVDFLFPRTAFEGAFRWLATSPAADDRAPFWQHDHSPIDAWSGATLTARVIVEIRRQLHDPSFARVLAYLGKPTPAVSAREAAFAQQVSQCIERLLHDRPRDAQSWSRDPASAPPEHVWLGKLVRALHQTESRPSPAQQLDAMNHHPPLGSSRHLVVFGLSTLRPGDKDRLAALARHMPVHVFSLTPSAEWWEDIRKHSEQRAALRRAKDSSTIAATLAELDRQNAMLAANGAPSRDMQLWLESVGYDEPWSPPPAPPPSTLLGAVQAWIERAGDNPQPPSAAPSSAAPDGEGAAMRAHAHCDSLEVHACHGPLRQCEALRDELLRRFAADPTLEPRHVLVMTPNVADYAPLLAAVFARTSEETPPIPLHIADLGLRATNPVADVLIAVLTLAEERVNASRLLELLSNAPLRARFAIEDDDLAELREMIVESGMRWAFDASDRARHDQPALDQHTLRFGLERLALGVLMPDTGGLDAVPAGVHESFGASVPIDVATRERARRFGALAALCESLALETESLRLPTAAAEWRTRMRRLLDAFTAVEDRQAWMRTQVDEVLRALLPDGPPDAPPIDRSALLAMLSGAFELARQGDRAVTGAVTVCALEPMRSVPFRVIAILGLDDGAFPRAGHAPSWDPFAEPRHAEHDRRAIDRHLFLEAMLCARDALLLFGTGFEPQRATPAPLSIVVTELLEVLGGALGQEPEARIVRHPLQPWSERAFAHDQRRPFDGIWQEAARALAAPAEQAGLAASKHAAPWPPEPHPSSVTARELAAALAKPTRTLLRDRLGLSFRDDDGEIPDREALETNELETWVIRDRVLQASDRGAPDLEALASRLYGEGQLPLRAAGRRVLQEALAQATVAIEQANAISGTRVAPVGASVDIDGVQVDALAEDVRDDGGALRLVWRTAGTLPNEQTQLLSWVTLLVLRASGAPVKSAHVAACGKAIELSAPTDPELARTHLRALLTTWSKLRDGPGHLFTKLSRAIVEHAMAEPNEPAETWLRKAQGAWQGAGNARGDVDDPYVDALYGHLTFDELVAHAAEIAQAARPVWEPLLGALVKGKSARGGASASGKGSRDQGGTS